MTGTEELLPADLIGRRLLRVTTSWHHDAANDATLLHLWLHLEGLGPVRVHTPGTGLSLTVDQPHEPYSMAEYGNVSVLDDSPETPVTRFVGRQIRSVREIRYRDGRVDFAAGLTLLFPDGSVRLLALDDELVVAHDQHLGAVEAHLDEDVTIARAVQTCGGCPAQWDAWTTGGQYLYLRYRHGQGSVEAFPSEDPVHWGGEGPGLRSAWDDGTSGGEIDLTDFLAMAGLHLAPDAEVHPYR
ncbi:hypothetical protein GCM10009665_40360 [Kitasatospora nipponensis]|uniref:Uncharacterized protein n=1 Tax=Kitasatospora nipponensis TaxID=258049 RepID=A0ABP4GZU3_9ACTN